MKKIKDKKFQYKELTIVLNDTGNNSNLAESHYMPFKYRTQQKIIIFYNTLQKIQLKNILVHELTHYFFRDWLMLNTSSKHNVYEDLSELIALFNEIYFPVINKYSNDIHKILTKKYKRLFK